MSYETATESIGQEIARQIGNRAFFMMGARNLLAGDSCLYFSIGRNGKGINAVRITLTPLDVYDLEFSRIRGSKKTVVAEVAGIYCDQLHDVLASQTGLRLSL